MYFTVSMGEIATIYSRISLIRKIINEYDDDDEEVKLSFVGLGIVLNALHVSQCACAVNEITQY